MNKLSSCFIGFQVIGVQCMSSISSLCVLLQGAPRFYSGVTKQIFGSPSYPSPLDRIRTGRKERAKQLGVPSSDKDSFEKNQSFPKIKQCRVKQDVDCTLEVKTTLNDFKGENTKYLTEKSQM